jgi:hypothetical protein
MYEQKFFFKIEGGKTFPGLKFAAGTMTHRASKADPARSEWRIAGRPLIFNGRADGLALLTELSEITGQTPRELLAKVEARCKAIGIDFESTKELARELLKFEQGGIASRHNEKA